MAADPQTTGILATLISIVALMATRELREHRERRASPNGTGGPSPIRCALAKERYDALERMLADVIGTIDGLDDLAKGSFQPSHAALSKAIEEQAKYLREIRDASIATSSGVAELVAHRRNAAH